MKTRIPALFLLGAGCAPEVLPEPSAYDAHPEPPTIDRDVSMISDDLSFTHPYVPGHRTSMDGRVAVRVQGGPPGGTQLSTQLSFYLFVPEQLQAPILTGPDGPEILDETAIHVDFPPALDPAVTRLGHHAICDPTTEVPEPGERPNPYACGPDDTHDCYELVIVSSTSNEITTQLWGTPVLVEVSDPKTADAALVSVELGEAVPGGTIPTASEWTEPAVTVDGRLLTGRFGRFPRTWTNPETGERLTRAYDLAYSVLPEDSAPCDITGWTDFHPMSHAPYDPQMIGRYGLAAYPFRDSEGNPIPDGEDLGGTYPWVDREGANVFMAGVHGRIAEQSQMLWPRDCVHEGCDDYRENIDWDRGFLVAGLWTHGKLVHLDGLINHLDWAVGVAPNTHWNVDMYREGGAWAEPVRVGAGRFIRELRSDIEAYPEGYTHNANILDSLQNVATHVHEGKPVTPRDVVWVMSSGVATDEIAFDDFLDPDALIVANMQASITQVLDTQGNTTSVPYHHNGQVRVLDGPAVLGETILKPEELEDIHLQNAATSLRWNPPSYGLIDAYTARIEPVARGGVHGRGLWLSGTNEVRWELPAQPRDVRDMDWYLGVFVDDRAQPDEAHALLTFPDGSGIWLHGTDEVVYRRGDRRIHEAYIPDGVPSGWRHFGWRITNGGREVTLLVNGFPVDRATFGRPFALPTEGTLTLGRAGDAAWGLRGWVDDLVLLAHDVDPEVACNHADGTLVRLDDADTALLDRAGAYPTWAHEELAARLGDGASETYFCWTNPNDDTEGHLADLPAGSTGLRHAVTFPEGPVRYGAPRPDSSDNAFCLTCHSEEGRDGLGLDALVPLSLNAEDDPRRQPMQPPRRVFGNIPAGWIPTGEGVGGPATSVVAPEEGLLVDQWVLPH